MKPIYPFARFAYRTLIAPWPPYAVFLIVIGAIGGAVPLLHIYATTHLIDMLMAERARADASSIDLLMPYAPYLGLLIGMMALHWILYYDTFQRYLAAHLNERVVQRFNKTFFWRVFALPLERFEYPEQHDTMTRAYRAINGIHPRGQSQIAAQELYAVQRLISCTTGAITILYALSKVNIAIVLILLIGGLYMMRWSMRHERQFIDIHYDQTARQRQRDYWGRLLTERAHAAEIRLFGLGNYMLSAWRVLNDAMIREIADARRTFTQTLLILLAIMAGLFGLSIALLIDQSSRGTLGIGQFVAMLYAIHHYLFFLHNNGHRITRMQWFFAELRYAYDFMEKEAPPSRSFPTTDATASDAVPEVIFEGVSFAYPGAEKPALSNIDLRIRAGERVALLGENGSGKTTLVKLLLGLYQPTKGRIYIDGRPLDAIDPKTWRTQVAAAFQDYGRYAFRVRENIAFGNLDKRADEAAIQRAARQSAADEMIATLPRGYDTLLGREFETGTDLSGGQWQALALARAYLRDAKILALDEPTSALDALAEVAVYRRFSDLSKGKTVLLISHRLGAARLADRIVFLRRGRVAEVGTHAELIDAKSDYATSYAMQAARYRTEGSRDGE